MSHMTLEIAAKDIRDEFDFLDDWEDRYAHIIDLGKANPQLAETEMTEETRVRGCTSNVWILTAIDDEGRMHIRAMSDAMIVSGLIALLVRLFSGARVQDILDFDAEALLGTIGVTGALTAQRSNGLASMLVRIRSDAQRATASSQPADGTAKS